MCDMEGVNSRVDRPIKVATDHPEKINKEFCVLLEGLDFGGDVLEFAVQAGRRDQDSGAEVE